MQDFEYLPPFDKDPNERRLNPFEHDYAHMGTVIGDGLLVAMYDKHDNYTYVILVNTETGARVKIKM